MKIVFRIQDNMLTKLEIAQIVNILLYNKNSNIIINQHEKLKGTI